MSKNFVDINQMDDREDTPATIGSRLADDIIRQEIISMLEKAGARTPNLKRTNSLTPNLSSGLALTRHQSLVNRFQRNITVVETIKQRAL